MHLSGREVASQFGKCASCRSAAASMRAAGTPASRSRIDPCRCRYVATRHTIRIFGVSDFLKQAGCSFFYCSPQPQDRHLFWGGSIPFHSMYGRPKQKGKDGDQKNGGIVVNTTESKRSSHSMNEQRLASLLCPAFCSLRQTSTSNPWDASLLRFTYGIRVSNLARICTLLSTCFLL